MKIQKRRRYFNKKIMVKWVNYAKDSILDPNVANKQDFINWLNDSRTKRIMKYYKIKY